MGLLGAPGDIEGEKPPCPGRTAARKGWWEPDKWHRAHSQGIPLVLNRMELQVLTEQGKGTEQEGRA